MSVAKSSAIAPSVKVCTSCGVEKPLAEFSRGRNRKDGREYRCKPCVSAYHKEYLKRTYADRCKYPTDWPVGLDRHPNHPEVEYRPHAEFPGYLIGDDGTIWSRWRSNGFGLGDYWHPISPSKLKKGYLYAHLKSGDQILHRLVHRLVLEVFVGPCPEGMEARHILTNDPADCRLVNLKWGTPEENNEDKIRHGTHLVGSQLRQSKLTEDEVIEMRRLYAEGMPIKVLYPKFGVTKMTAYRAVKKISWAHVP